MIFLIILLALFFAMNMGGSSFAASFAAPYGSKIIGRGKAGILFVVFVVLGSLLLGKNVAVTLGKNIVSPEILSSKAIVVILFSAGLSMFVSNLMKIPQSTSLVTVAAIAGVGAHFGKVDLRTIYFLVPFWIGLPILSYVLTHFITGRIYPPRKTNFWIYERLINHQDKLKVFVIVASCYTAFAVGTNNVANVVGPLMGVDANVFMLLLVFSIIYGAGAFVFTEPIKTAGQKIVPLGLMTAAIIALVSGSLMIVASYFGVPQSFVMLNMGAIFAVSSLKDGHRMTFSKPLTRKTFYTWTINPVLTFFLSWVLATSILG